MNATDLDHFLLISQLSRVERTALAARCAQVAVRQLSSMSLPIGFKEMTALEDVVRLAAESALNGLNLAELSARMMSLRRLAFTPPAQCKFRSETVICQVARAAYAAGQTVFTGSSVDAQDALDAAFTVARTTESQEAEDSLREELRRVRKEALEAARRRRMNCSEAQTSLTIA
jgi:hypothetical protein